MTRSRVAYLLWFGLAYLYAVDMFPGFNFDEAWFSLRAQSYQANEALSFFGMNTHSGSLPQIFLSAVYRVFGASVEHYRVSYLALSLASLCAIAYWQRSYEWLVLALATPILFFQLRSGLEVSHFFIFFLALGFYPLKQILAGHRLSTWQQLLFVMSIFLGVWTHALYLSLLLSLEVWGLIFDSQRRLKKNASTIHLCHIAIAPLFVQMLWTSKWSFKAAAVLGGLLILSLLLSRKNLLAPKKLRILFVILSVHCLFNFIVFFDSSWNLLLYTGRVYFAGLTSTVWALACIYLFYKRMNSDQAKTYACLTLCLVAFSGWMTVTWAPKSFVLPVIFLCLTLDTMLAKPLERLIFCMLLVLPGIATQAWALKSYRDDGVQNTNFKFGLLKDGSYDFLPNLQFVRSLKQINICTKSDCLEIPDQRLQQIFQALLQLEGLSSGDMAKHVLKHCNRIDAHESDLLYFSDSRFCILKTR